jgi:carbon monoxide dehydrogenase subunit G
MFTVSAEFRDKIEVRASFDKVRDFLFDLQNFAKLMPNVESIRTDKRGVARWIISVDIPVVGKVRQSFPVELEETPGDEIEWRPAFGEKENLLRYFAILIEKDTQTTVVQISQKVELRRGKAKDLHALAAVAGENLISKEMNKRVAEMIKVFLQKARQELEI